MECTSAIAEEMNPVSKQEAVAKIKWIWFSS